MNAPGDSALIVVLLAVFVACSAYAAGRLHQRWQAAQDRAEAYRDGYENGTSNVFSTAVRMLGPKRSARGAAPVKTASPPEPAAAAPDAPPAAPEEPGFSPALGFPAPPPPPPYAISEPGAVGGVVYQRLRDPRATDGSAPVMGERPTMPPVPHPRPADRLRPTTGTAATPDELGHAEQPEVIKIHEGRRQRGDTDTAAAPAPAPATPTPTAATATPTAAKATPTAATPAAPVKRRRGGHRAKPPEDDTTINQAAQPQPDVPSGRHTVPDELVRATTYRLPPDRIFRAKVPENTPLPDEPTTRLPSVPKPRDES